MRLAALAVSLVLLSTAALADNPHELNLNGYQLPDGAITVHFQGDKVDPYFATKALLVARDGNLKTQKPAERWIKWLMARQREDGLFERYERNPADHQWITYAAADADDAMQALWLQLLYRMAPKSGLPKAWQESARKAEETLAALYDTEQGVYHISTSLRVGLLMDNAEVYSALLSIARDLRRMRQYDKAREYEARAEKLAGAIHRIFYKEHKKRFRITTQKRNENDFYPDKVAQLFPVLYKLSDEETAEAIYAKWIDDHGPEWIRQRNEDFPWGLVAVTALDMKDDDSASCWQNRAEPLRYSRNWNVLEEAALQHVKSRIALYGDPKKIPCVGGKLV